MKLVFIFSLFYLQACTLCKSSDVNSTIECLNSLQTRDIVSESQVSDYLQKHPVIISLTTSPTRLTTLIQTLRTLDTSHVTHIWLALPKQYKNKEDYGSVPAEVQNFPKLDTIARNQSDLGPISKILPALEKAKELDPDAIVISIDDDAGFPKGAINELIYHAILFPHAVVGGSGNYAEFWGIQRNEWPTSGKATKEPYCGASGVSYCDLIEGWRAIAYKPRLVNIERLKKLSQLSKACRTSDDLVISYVLAESGVDKIRVSNAYYQDIHRFETGSDEGALHKIHLHIPGWSPRHSVDAFFDRESTNSERYQRCVLDILSET